MNTTKKFFYSLMAICVLGLSACSSDSEDGLYDSVDRTKITNPDKNSVDRTKITNPDKKESVDRTKITNPDKN